ncbi:MAG: tetraacyldisaccharide 4'-kinase [Bacteroidetes bacterium]|nr:tetraacyldisaccharide 4'-kinase [Bacteroidota bacterium]
MNHNNIFLKSFRVLLLPFSIIYGCVVAIRNYLFDRNTLKSSTFNFPIICVGNLAVGGTGKSPMVEYLVRLLKDEFAIATLSRGYKRKTKGYVLASEKTTALEIGDEPMQFHLKFPEVAVAVGEERVVAVPHLLQDKPNLQAIILDDAFQHRQINAGFNILLTEYANRFTYDFFLPTGDLRDERKSYKRANIIVVTKCPAEINEIKKKKLLYEIHAWPGQQVFFTKINYATPYHIFDKNKTFELTGKEEVLLVCGIANPKPLKDYLHNKTHTYYQINFSDHHIFNIDDLNNIKKKFEGIDAKNKIILTTEKDAVRFVKFDKELNELPIYVLPITHEFLFNEGDLFDKTVLNYIKNHYKLKEESKEIEK